MFVSLAYESWKYLEFIRIHVTKSHYLQHFKKVKFKGKVIPLQARCGPEGGSSMTAVLEVGEWSAARTDRTLPPEKGPVPILEEAGWAPGPGWTDGKSRPHRDSIPDRPARSQSLYRLSYPAHILRKYNCKFYFGAFSISRFPEELFLIQKTLKIRGFVNKLLQIA